MLQFESFRVQNYRNIDDSNWIPVERVTNFVGRNESGKSALLKALHKFNPATTEAYDPQKEFPRDRYARDYIATGSKGSDWPVCLVSFILSDDLKSEISPLLDPDQELPDKAIVTRFYDGSLSFQYEPEIKENDLTPDLIISGFSKLIGDLIHRSNSESLQNDTATLKIEMSEWIAGWRDRLETTGDLRNPIGVDLLDQLFKDLGARSNSQNIDIIEEFQSRVNSMLIIAKDGPVLERINELVKDKLPVFIYFDNYGIIDSAIWLPRFIEDLDRGETNPRVKTINAMFKQVNLDPREITELGTEEAQNITEQGNSPPADVIAKDQTRKAERAIRLNSASRTISELFSNWWLQRRHTIRYDADGNYFRIWVADERRSNVDIELEARSRGFQWFFSFYLIFLFESEGGHKDAILLLDEPGLHLHPTAQQALIAFFEKLSEKNQILYSTHSPFLVDGNHLSRVRPVTEDDTGHSLISVENWPKDRETIFPLQAAAGYAMVRGLFRHAKNVLVEGMADYYYLHALSHQCSQTERMSLPEDIYITPCGGTKLVSHFASLFLGQEVRPLILLDGDDAGRVRRDSLMNDLYARNDNSILMLDDVLDRAGQEVEIEDILGESIIMPAFEVEVSRDIKLNAADREGKSLPSAIKSAANRQNIDLPKGWKASVAIRLVSEWAKERTQLPDEVLARAELLFNSINQRFT